MTGIIDTHAHVYPSDHLDALEALGLDPASTRIARGMRADATADDMAVRLAWMDQAGVDAQVLSVMPQGGVRLRCEGGRRGGSKRQRHLCTPSRHLPWSLLRLRSPASAPR